LELLTEEVIDGVICLTKQRSSHQVKAQVNRFGIQIIQDDMLSLGVAGLVTVTDSTLAVNSALAAKAGPAVQAACAAIGSCEVGSAVATMPGKLHVEKIIHAVAPRWGEGAERGKLANVTWQCLWLAERHGLKSIALPAISAGTLGYPLENCAKTMLTQIVDFTFEKVKNLRTILVCVDNPVALEVFEQEFQRQIEELMQTGEGKVRV
jgi:O-acetyl-ADP-ribose deacetylase (regulator of RNase III)